MAIKITAEIEPHGDASRAFKVGEIYLWNTGIYGDPEHRVGNYGYELNGDWLHFTQEHDPEISHEGYIVGFPRDQGGLWELVRRALEDSKEDIFVE